MGQTVGTKIVNLAGNVVLAWLLLEEDFGVVGLAYTFTIVASLIQRGSVREVLVHRQASFRRWVNPAFWMAATMGVLSGLAMAASAPIAAHVYGDRQLIGIIGVLALAAPIQSLAVVTEAKLQNQFRFKLLASIALATTVMMISGKVLLAWLGFGAYSFVLPEPFVHALRAAVLWWAVRPRIRLTPQFRRWRYLVGDSVTVLAANAAVTVALLGDCVVLGLWTSPAVVGVYYFALRNSNQTIHLFTHNVAKVLFPALSRLQADVPRQQHGSEDRVPIGMGEHDRTSTRGLRGGRRFVGGRSTRSAFVPLGAPDDNRSSSRRSPSRPTERLGAPRR